MAFPWRPVPNDFCGVGCRLDWVCVVQQQFWNLYMRLNDQVPPTGHPGCTFIDLYQRTVTLTRATLPTLHILMQGGRMRRYTGLLFKRGASLVFAAVLAVSMVGFVQADRLTTGNDLMRHCVSSPDNFCAGYIGGVIDTSHTLFCIPPDVSKREIINITIIFLRDHSDKLGLYAPNLIIKAMRTAFPCNDGM